MKPISILLIFTFQIFISCGSSNNENSNSKITASKVKASEPSSPTKTKTKTKKKEKVKTSKWKRQSKDLKLTDEQVGNLEKLEVSFRKQIAQPGADKKKIGKTRKAGIQKILSKSQWKQYKKLLRDK